MNLFTMEIDNNNLVDAVYFFILDHCQTKYMHADEIADAINIEHGWDITKVNVYSAVKIINQTVLPKYQYEIHSDTTKGYAIRTDNQLTAPMKQCLGLIENIAKSGKDLRLFYKKLNEVTSQVLAEGQQDFSNNIYKKKMEVR